jgi:dGTPase
MRNREELEAREAQILDRRAVFAARSLGRRLPETEDALRTCFQRDRDRILHSAAFRRLQQKTQVLPATTGDHYRTRLTHSLEVSQLARSASLTLGLNPDLAETVALAHDLGHPPFGHVGEKALDRLLDEHGGYRHNAQVLRILDDLEDRYPHGYGLNLSWETRLCLIKHRVPDGFPMSSDLPRKETPYLEGQIVDLCDRAAYVAHDMDDALRGGHVRWEEFAELSLPREADERAMDKLDKLRFEAGLSEEPNEKQLIRRRVSTMVSILVQDLVRATGSSLQAARLIQDCDQAREEPYLVCHTTKRKGEIQELLKFLNEKFYRHPEVFEAVQQAAKRMTQVYGRILAEPSLLPQRFRVRIDAEGLERTVGDYVGGMTDRYVERLSQS